MTDRSHDSSAGASARDVRETDRSTEPGGASRWRRAAAAVLGGALLVRGLRRRSLRGGATALVGAWLAYRGVAGRRRRARQARAPGTGPARSETGGLGS